MSENTPDEETPQPEDNAAAKPEERVLPRIILTPEQIPPAPTDAGGKPLFVVSAKMINYILVRVAEPLLAPHAAVKVAGASDATLTRWRKMPGFRDWERTAVTSPILDLIGIVSPQVLFNRLNSSDYHFLQMGLKVAGHLQEGARVSVTNKNTNKAEATGIDSLYLCLPEDEMEEDPLEQLQDLDEEEDIEGEDTQDAE